MISRKRSISYVESPALSPMGSRFGSQLSIIRVNSVQPDSGETANNVPNTPEDNETPKQRKARYRSLGVVFIVQFLTLLQNSIFWNSMWPFLSSIDSTATESFYGIVLMVFHAASALGSPLFGYWTNRSQQCKTPIIAGICISIVGNILTASVEAFDTNRKWILLVARIITGFGCGNYGPLYAYIVMASTTNERARAISLRAAMNSAALMLGSALAIAFVPIGFPGFVVGRFHLDLYTATAWTCAIAGIIQVIILSIWFTEHWISVDASQMNPNPDKQASQSNAENQKNIIVEPVKNEPSELKPYNKRAALACIWIRMVYVFPNSFPLTIGSPFAMLMFGWTATDTVLYNGIIDVVNACLDFTGNLIMGHIVLKYVQERKTIIFGLILALIYIILIFPYPDIEPLLFAQNSTILEANGSLTNVSTINIMTTVGSVCNYSWCPYTTRVSLALYILANVFVMLSVSVGYTPNASLFSKVLGPRKQGALQGVFAGASQFSQCLSPLIIGTVWQLYGPRVTFGIGGAIITSSIIIFTVSYEQLVPWAEYEYEPKKIKGTADQSAIDKIKSQLRFAVNLHNGAKEYDETKPLLTQS